MAKDQALHDYIVKDLMKDIPGITSRAMFGGWGIYKDGVIFGLIADGELYFKVNETNINEFKSKGSHPFVYQGKHKQVTMSYWTLPSEILENPEELPQWVENSIR